MNNLIEYLYEALFTAPAAIALGGAALLLLSAESRYSLTEIRIKRTALSYLCVSFVFYLSVVFYVYWPEGFVCIQSLFYLAVLGVPVLFYRFFYLLTASDGRRFPRWHYIVPLVIVAPLALWSFFVPFEIQLEITRGLRAVVPRGYETYTLYFISKQPVGILYSLFYAVLTIVRLWKYYRRINASSNLTRRPARWIVLLAMFMLTSLLLILLGSFVQHSGLYFSLTSAGVSAMMAAQHIVLTYIVLQRRYVLYVLPLTEGDTSSMSAAAKKRRVDLLTRKHFDAWVREHRPWLAPAYKLTDMAASTGINRNYISRFINKTYGVNFNQYMNARRLEELRRLSALPSNKGKPIKDLVETAGFYRPRHYYDALAAEKRKKR